MKILVRLPNWLGDMVMSTAFLKALKAEYPEARIDVIVKKGLDSLVDFFTEVEHRWVFDKNESGGLSGAYNFGRNIKKNEAYDLFFCLPDSFSSALMAFATGASKRVGFRKEFRSIFLTKAYQRPLSIHRVEQYLSLLTAFTGKKYAANVSLHSETRPVQNQILLNFNSEAESRRMPAAKAALIVNRLTEKMPAADFLCLGSTKDKAHVEAILRLTNKSAKVHNVAGTTATVAELVRLIGGGSGMISTDSGPAHVANALGLPTIVTFGAGNEKYTRPYNEEKLAVLRLGQLPCEPCEKNICKFGLPKCLELLEEDRIVESLKKLNIS